jgi:hypothetical protein
MLMAHPGANLLRLSKYGNRTCSARRDGSLQVLARVLPLALRFRPIRDRGIEIRQTGSKVSRSPSLRSKRYAIKSNSAGIQHLIAIEP